MIPNWMLYTVGLSGALALAAFAIDAAARAARWPTRQLWAAALLLSVVVPLASAFRPPTSAPRGRVAVRVATVPPSTPARLRLDVDGPLGVAWLVGSVSVFLIVGMGLTQLRRAAKHSRRLEVDRTPVAVTDRIGPGVAPFGQPRIMVPAWFQSIPARGQRLLIHHEREHVRARDAELLLAGWLVVAIAPWNPFAWWMLRRLARAIELDCDARVLRRAAVRPYGELLLHVAARIVRSRPVGMLAFTRSSSELAERIEQMTRPRETPPPVRQLGLAALAAAALVAACEAPAPEPIGPSVNLVAEARTDESAQPASNPLVVIHAANGTELFRDHRLPNLAPNTIEKIDVVKGQGREDTIYVTLKVDAPWPQAAPQPTPPGTGKLRTIKEPQ